MFTYSFEPDTPAARLPDHLPEEVKDERRDRLMAVQQEIAFAWNERQIGRTLDVLLDAPVAGRKERLDRPQPTPTPPTSTAWSTSPARNCAPGKSCPVKSWPPESMI